MEPLGVAIVGVMIVGAVGVVAAVAVARARGASDMDRPGPPAAAAPARGAPIQRATDEEPVGDPETVGDSDTVSDAITVNASNVEEKELSLAEKEELRALIDEAIELVEAVIFEPFDVDDSDAMVKAVAACVDGLRRGAAWPDRWPDHEAAARLLGLLWGEHLVVTASWRWVRMSAGPHQGYAVVSPDRAHAVFPTEVVQKVLSDPDRASPLVPVYEAVRDRRVLAAAPGSRTPLA